MCDTIGHNMIDMNHHTYVILGSKIPFVTEYTGNSLVAGDLGVVVDSRGDVYAGYIVDIYDGLNWKINIGSQVKIVSDSWPVWCEDCVNFIKNKSGIKIDSYDIDVMVICCN